MAGTLIRNLCSLEDVKARVHGLAPDDDRLDRELIRLVNETSRWIMQKSGRELVAIASGSTTRLFDLADGMAAERQVAIGDWTSVSGARLLQQDGTVVETVAAGSWVALPRTREEWEPITDLWFPSAAAVPTALRDGLVLEVTGVPGFPSVPADVREACCTIAIGRNVTQLAKIAPAFSQVAGTVDFSRAFANAMDVVRGYRVPVIA